jgi:hypothetical protein
MSPENLKRLRFFEGLLTVSNSRSPLFRNIKPDSKHSYLNAGGGKTGVHWRYEVSENEGAAQFYLNHFDPKINELVNKERYLFLFEKKYEINEAFGEPLDWNYRKDRKIQYIQSLCNLGGWATENKWPEIYGDLVNRLVSLEKALKYYIDRLP